MTPIRLRQIHACAKNLVQENSPDERTLLAKYILELIEVLPHELKTPEGPRYPCGTPILDGDAVSITATGETATVVRFHKPSTVEVDTGKKVIRVPAPMLTFVCR